MIILEGTDAVGKTSTIHELKKENIICLDRSKDVISKYMLFDYSLEYRASKYYQYLKENDCIIIFLVNNTNWVAAVKLLEVYISDLCLYICL